MFIDLAYLEATMQNLLAQEATARAQEAEARELSQKVAGAKLLCEAMLAKVREDIAKSEAASESGGEG
jgi:hypothetical protein